MRDTPTFHQLRSFVALARHGRHSLAAEELGVGQSTLSAQIAALERALGLELCEQFGGRTRLTGAGEELIEIARETMRVRDEAMEAMAERSGAATLHPARLAADTTVGIYVLPQLLGTLHSTHPQVRVTLEIANRAGVIAMLAQDDVDMVLLGQPPDLPDLVVEPFRPHDLVVFAAPTHPLAGERHIPFARVAEEPMVLREPGSGTRHTVETLCAEVGAQVQVALELGHNGAVKAAVAAGFGLGVMSTIAIGREIGLGRLVILDVDGFPIQRHWHIVRRRPHRLSAAATAVLAFLLEARVREPRATVERDAEDETRPPG